MYIEFTKPSPKVCFDHREKKTKKQNFLVILPICLKLRVSFAFPPNVSRQMFPFMSKSIYSGTYSSALTLIEVTSSTLPRLCCYTVKWSVSLACSLVACFGWWTDILIYFLVVTPDVSTATVNDKVYLYTISPKQVSLFSSRDPIYTGHVLL